MADTKIEWANKTWNPITGCTPVSTGCRHCYAKHMAHRLRGRHGYPADEPFRVTYHADRLEQPYRWRKPCRIFVCSMGDLFHEDVQPIIHWQIMKVINDNPRHCFILLTKRPENIDPTLLPPAPNLWLGVTAENQKCAEERLDKLCEIPAAVRFVSVEPMLERINLIPWLSRLDWVICGAETGPGKRPMENSWARDLQMQCHVDDVAFFFKKDSKLNRKLNGRLWEEWPSNTLTP